MKVIICDAGMIGSGIAKYLSQENTDVVVIDPDENLLRRISYTLDILTVVGCPTHPDVLERAGVREAQLIIASTSSDEVNMMACQVAHCLFEVPLKIAYVKSSVYFKNSWSKLFNTQAIAVDVLISPEREVAKAIARTLQVPGAFDLIPLADNKIYVVGVRCNVQCPMAFTPIRQLTNLFPDLNISILAILRGDQVILPNGEEQMLPGDDIYFLAEKEHVVRAMQIFGYKQKTSRHILILGAGNIGVSLAMLLEEEDPTLTVKIIENTKERATKAAQLLEKGVVLYGDALDSQLLIEANVQNTESVVAVTDDNEVNILASLLAKRNGAQQAITLINNPTYTPLVTPLGIDAVISPRDITISSILHHVRRGRIRSIFSLREGLGEIIEAEILESSPIVGNTINYLNNSKNLIVGAVIREEQVVIANDGLILRARDLVILFTLSSAIQEVEELFSSKGEYF